MHPERLYGSASDIQPGLGRVDPEVGGEAGREDELAGADARAVGGHGGQVDLEHLFLPLGAVAQGEEVDLDHAVDEAEALGRYRGDGARMRDVLLPDVERIGDIGGGG